MLKNHMSLVDSKHKRNKINNQIRKEKKYFSKIIVIKTNKTLKL